MIAREFFVKVGNTTVNKLLMQEAVAFDQRIINATIKTEWRQPATVSPQSGDQHFLTKILAEIIALTGCQKGQQIAH
jgi:hypothetical protein